MLAGIIAHKSLVLFHLLLAADRIRKEYFVASASRIIISSWPKELQTIQRTVPGKRKFNRQECVRVLNVALARE